MIDIHAIRAADPLPSIAGAQVRLDRAGSELKGCCPFHADRSSIFTIYGGGEHFMCFGCGASGDVLDYVARLYGVCMAEAARILSGGDPPGQIRAAAKAANCARADLSIGAVKHRRPTGNGRAAQ